MRGVGLAMAPSTERHQLVEIEVGAALSPLHQVVHVKPAPGSAGLTAPARADQNRGLDGLPLLDRGGGAAGGPGASSTAPLSRGASNPGRALHATSPPGGSAGRRVCPRGQTFWGSRKFVSAPPG